MIAAAEAVGEWLWQWMCYGVSGCEGTAACINDRCDADVSVCVCRSRRVALVCARTRRCCFSNRLDSEIEMTGHEAETSHQPPHDTSAERRGRRS